MTPECQILIGDVREKLRELPANSVQCAVTSPPYWALRDYGHSSQIGLEKTLAQYLAVMTDVFNEVLRVLKPNGTCWVNMGDCYAGAGLSGGKSASKNTGTLSFRGAIGHGRVNCDGLKAKDLVGQPWRLAFALQAAGWYLRQDIIWHKPNPMPESIADRCTKAHEYLFLLSKSGSYYFNSEAIRERVTGNAHSRGHGVNPKAHGHNSRINVDRDPAHQTKAKIRAKQNRSFSAAISGKGLVSTRNKRSVWTIATAPYRGAHFATFPADLVKPCIMAGTKPGDVVLDPFAGSGTTGMVAIELGRRAVLIELNPEYGALIRQRCAVTSGLPLSA